MKMIRLAVLVVAGLHLSACAGPWGAGDRHFRSGDFVSAHDAYQAARAQSPAPPDPETALRAEKARLEAARQLHRRALEQADQGDLNGAIQLLERARKADPANRDIEDALERTGQLKDAALRSAQIQYLAALEPASRKDWAAALPFYERAIALDRNHLPARVERHRASEEKSEAERLHQEGREHLGGRRLRSALASFEAARGRWPFHPQVEASLAEVNLLLSHARGLIEAGRAAASAGRRREALEKFEEALRFQPSSVDAASARADLLLAAAADLSAMGYDVCSSIVAAELRVLVSGFRDEAGAEVSGLGAGSASARAEEERRLDRIRRRAGYSLRLAAEGTGSESGFGSSFLRDLAGAWRKLQEDARLELLEPRREAGKTALKSNGEYLLRVRLAGPETIDELERQPLEKKYISGYLQEPNPEYQRAADDLRAAEEAHARAVEAHRRKLAPAQPAGSGPVAPAAAAPVPGEHALPEAAALERARSRLAGTPKFNRVPIEAVHHYARIAVERRARLRVSWEIIAPGFSENGSETFECSASGSKFENPRPDLGIPADAPEPKSAGELRRTVATAARDWVAAQGESALRRRHASRFLALAEDARRAGDLAGAIELAADAFFASPQEAPLALLEKEFIAIADVPLEGLGPVRDGLRVRLLPPPANFAPLLDIRQPFRHPGAEAADLVIELGPLREAAPADAPPLRLIAAGVRPDPLARGSQAELFIEYEVREGTVRMIEERRTILYGGEPVEGMPLARIFEIEGEIRGRRRIESVVHLPVPAEGISAGEYELQVLALAGTIVESHRAKFTVR